MRDDVENYIDSGFWRQLCRHVCFGSNSMNTLFALPDLTDNTEETRDKEAPPEPLLLWHWNMAIKYNFSVTANITWVSRKPDFIITGCITSLFFSPFSLSLSVFFLSRLTTGVVRGPRLGWHQNSIWSFYLSAAGYLALHAASVVGRVWNVGWREMGWSVSRGKREREREGQKEGLRSGIGEFQYEVHAFLFI